MTARIWLAAAFMLSTGAVRAEVQFEDGAKVNLAAVRGAKVGASDNCITAADLVCRPVHTTEMRFHSDYGRAWWMIEWPRPYQVSSHRIGHRDPMVSVGYQVKASLQPLDEAGWAATKPVFEFRGLVAKLGHDGLSSGWTEGNWPPVEARFVRIEWLGHNGGERGEAGRDHPDLIVGKIQLRGPNLLAITPESIACNRDPRDGRIDVFAEEDFAHSLLWYRFDDSQIKTQRVWIDHVGEN